MTRDRFVLIHLRILWCNEQVGRIRYGPADLAACNRECRHAHEPLRVCYVELLKAGAPHSWSYGEWADRGGPLEASLTPGHKGDSNTWEIASWLSPANVRGSYGSRGDFCSASFGRGRGVPGRGPVGGHQDRPRGPGGEPGDQTLRRGWQGGGTRGRGVTMGRPQGQLTNHANHCGSTPAAPAGDNHSSECEAYLMQGLCYISRDRADLNCVERSYLTVL